MGEMAITMIKCPICNGKAKPEIVKRLREKFEVDMTYHSNAIEGNRLTLRETWLVLRR